VIVLLLVSVGAMLFVKPEYRDQSWRWVQQKAAALRGGAKPATLPSNALPAKKPEISRKTPVNGANASKAADKKPAPALMTGPMPQPAPATEPPKAQPKPVEINPPLTPVVSQISAPAPAPGANTPAPIEKPTGPTVAISAPPSAAPNPAPAPAKAAPPEPAVSVDPVEQARTLWRKAIDAEANQDFVEAVKCYGQIKKLPADVQPAGLEVRLELAKKQMPK
jgi:hypothetical protein